MAELPLPYVPIDPRIRESDRFLDFVEVADLADDPHALMYILELLLFAGRNHVDGNLGRVTPQRLARRCYWTGDPLKFVEALLEARWLRRADDGSLVIEGWERHGGRVFKDRVRHRRAFKQNSSTLREPPGGSRSLPEVPGTHGILPPEGEGEGEIDLSARSAVNPSPVDRPVDNSLDPADVDAAGPASPVNAQALEDRPASRDEDEPWEKHLADEAPEAPESPQKGEGRRPALRALRGGDASDTRHPDATGDPPAAETAEEVEKLMRRLSGKWQNLPRTWHERIEGQGLKRPWTAREIAVAIEAARRYVAAPSKFNFGIVASNMLSARERQQNAAGSSGR